MPTRSSVRHYSLIAAVAAVLIGLLYLQFNNELPDGLQVSNANTLRAKHPGCALAEVPGDHMLVAAAVWEGAIPTDLVIGTIPHVSKMVRVSVAPGDRPLTVFLSGYGAIWDFSGAVERVQRVVAVSPMFDRRTAVAGIAAERIEFPVLRDCKLVAANPILSDEPARIQAMAAMFGRRADHTAFQTNAVHVSLPDATFGVRTEGAPAPRTLEPDQLVSSVAITRPTVLPGEAGLKQLEAAGAIRRPTPEEVDAFIVGASLPYRSKLSPDYRLSATFDYVITQEVTLPRPPPMKEWRFLVPAGVPAPRPASGMCIAEMDGFRVNNVSTCFKEGYEGIERLRRLPGPEKVASCRRFDVPEQVSLEAVAVYEPETAKRGFGQKPAPHPIEVRVDKPGDVVLVLTTYEPAIWRVSSGADTRIAGVVLIGYYTSSVEGIAEDTPVLHADHQGMAARPRPEKECFPFQFWTGTAFRGGPYAMALDRQVLALTGRHLDGLRGAYRLKSATVR